MLVLGLLLLLASASFLALAFGARSYKLRVTRYTPQLTGYESQATRYDGEALDAAALELGY